VGKEKLKGQNELMGKVKDYYLRADLHGMNTKKEEKFD